jgi:hypothetical protein
LTEEERRALLALVEMQDAERARAMFEHFSPTEQDTYQNSLEYYRDRNKSPLPRPNHPRRHQADQRQPGQRDQPHDRHLFIGDQ